VGQGVHDPVGFPQSGGRDGQERDVGRIQVVGHPGLSPDAQQKKDVGKDAPDKKSCHAGSIPKSRQCADVSAHCLFFYTQQDDKFSFAKIHKCQIDDLMLHSRVID
jgi:hypothetical protein